MYRIYQSVIVSVALVTAIGLLGCAGETSNVEDALLDEQSQETSEENGELSGEGKQSETLVGKFQNSEASIGMITEGSQITVFVTDGTNDKHTMSAWFSGELKGDEFLLLPQKSAAQKGTAAAQFLSGKLVDGQALGTLVLTDGTSMEFEALTADQDSQAGLYINESDEQLSGLIVTNDLEVKAGSVQTETIELADTVSEVITLVNEPVLAEATPDLSKEQLEQLLIDDLKFVDVNDMIVVIEGEDNDVVDKPLLEVIEVVKDQPEKDDPKKPELEIKEHEHGKETDAPDTHIIKAPEDVIVVKFRDGQFRIRLFNEDPKNKDSKSYLIDEFKEGLQGKLAQDILHKVSDGEWSRIYSVHEDVLEKYYLSAIKKSKGEMFKDLNHYFALRLPKGLDREEARKMFLEMKEVENVYFPPTISVAIADNYQDPRGTYGDGYGGVYDYAYQRYLDAAPVGVDARYAWTFPGGNGNDVKVCDVEFAYIYAHTDLPEINNIGIPFYEDLDSYDAKLLNHGAATLGVIAGKNDGIGVTGIAHAADVWFSARGSLPVDVAIGWAYGLENSIFEGIAYGNLQAGDVIVLEQQLSGPNFGSGGTNGSPQFGMVPVEWYEPAYQAIKIATANELVVIEAAGNGYQDLNAPEYYGNPAAPHEPFLVENGVRVNDSGAIIIGAGFSQSDWSRYINDRPARARLDYSNFGSRVDVQGWGDSVVTCGPSSSATHELHSEGADDNNSFRDDYSGTSSASAVLGGVATSLQGAFKAGNDDILTSTEMRDLLIATGTPQEGDTSEHIGPLPDLRAAINASVEYVAPPTGGLGDFVFAEDYCDGTLPMPVPEFSIPEGMVPPGQSLQLQLSFGEITVQSAAIFYTTDGTIPTICSDPEVAGCNPSSQVWTISDVDQNSYLTFEYEELPVQILALQTTTACGANQPVSEIVAATYAPYSEIVAPVIYKNDGDVDSSNDLVVHQESKVFERSEIAAMPGGRLCVQFDSTMGTSPYIRYTLDGSEPIDSTEGWWEDPYGVVPYPSGLTWNTQQVASPIWTSTMNDQGQCAEVFNAEDPDGTIVTVKAKSFVYQGGGLWTPGAVAIESYLLID